MSDTGRKIIKNLYLLALQSYFKTDMLSKSKSIKFISFLDFYYLCCALWQYGLWSFQTGGIKLESFLPKNQHTQRKFLNFKFSIFFVLLCLDQPLQLQTLCCAKEAVSAVHSSFILLLDRKPKPFAN